MTAPTRVPCSYPECGGGCAGCQPEPQQTPRPSWVDGGAVLHSTEGWQLVPVEPTPEMMDAAWDHTPLNMDDMTDGDFGRAYKDMLAAAPSGWQAIETAPKDRDVLLYCKARGVVRGRWEDCYFARKPRPYWTNDREALFGVSGTRNDQPTHWMPLPPAPNQGEAS